MDFNTVETKSVSNIESKLAKAKEKQALVKKCELKQKQIITAKKKLEKMELELEALVEQL